MTWIILGIILHEILFFAYILYSAGRIGHLKTALSLEKAEVEASEKQYANLLKKVERYRADLVRPDGQFSHIELQPDPSAAESGSAAADVRSPSK